MVNSECYIVNSQRNWRWLSARLQYLYCSRTVDTAVLHKAIDMEPHGEVHQKMVDNMRLIWQCNPKYNIVNNKDYLRQPPLSSVTTKLAACQLLIFSHFIRLIYVVQGPLLLAWFKPASNDLGVYVKKMGKSSVVWRYTLQSIGPSVIVLNHQ